MNQRIRKLSDVVDWRLCLGCGVCAFICPEGKVRLADYLDEGIRPMVQDDKCGGCSQCLQACPAVCSDFEFERHSIPENREWGPILELWEGYASDEEIRFKGSSGGALTAISLYCIEQLNMHGVLHIAQDPSEPLCNRTRLSRNRTELLSATGSRYSPASVCDHLEWVERAPSPCVVIGKPSEMAAIKNARKLRPILDQKIGLTLSFFCAESPSTRGTLSLLKKLNIDAHSVADLRYRGHGWPGHFAPVMKGNTEPATRMTYKESWGFLQSFRPWSVQLWPDGSGELADISCGDPWYETPDGRNPGFSLVVARTRKGREIIHGAIKAGYLQLQPAERWKLEKSQSGLLTKKGSVWGRRLALRLVGLPVTQFKGLRLFDCWRKLSTPEKLKSTFGTLRRLLSRKLYQRLDLSRAAHRLTR